MDFGLFDNGALLKPALGDVVSLVHFITCHEQTE